MTSSFIDININTKNPSNLGPNEQSSPDNNSNTKLPKQKKMETFLLKQRKFLIIIYVSNLYIKPNNN